MNQMQDNYYYDSTYFTCLDFDFQELCIHLNLLTLRVKKTMKISVLEKKHKQTHLESEQF